MSLNERYNTGDTGFCRHAGHSGTVELTWEGNTVIDIACGFGNPKTCEYSDQCELYNRRPIGFTKTISGAPNG